MKVIPLFLLLVSILLLGHQPAFCQTTCINCQTNTSSKATGVNAVAVGTNSVASGVNSIAIGTNDTCIGDYSNAIGLHLKVLGNGSIAVGNSNTIIGPNGFAAGLGNTVNGTSSFAIGSYNNSTGNNSISLGNYVNATGLNSFGVGNFITAGGRYSMALGRSIQSNGFGSITIGSGLSGSQPLVNNIDSSFMLGFNSTIPTLFVGPSNAGTGLGLVGIGTTTPKAALDVKGNIAVNGKAVVGMDGKWLGDTAGMKGPPGINGATWFTGTGNPSGATGYNNDLYLNTNTDSVFQKQNNSWQGVAAIKGAAGTPGSPGTDGSVWYTGSSNPINSAYRNNDLYLNISSDTLFQKINNVWQKIAYIKGGQGIQGVPGTNGSTWITGSSNPGSITGNNNDLYLNTSTDSVFQKISGIWQKIASIRGQQGIQGSTGTQGPSGPTGPQGPSGSDGSCSTIACAAVATAASATIAAAVLAGTEALTAATTTAVGAVEAAGAQAVLEVEAAGTQAVGEVEAAGTKAVGEVQAEVAKAEKAATDAQQSETNAKQSADESKQSADSSKKYADEASKQMNGNANGDLSGKYPNPTVNKLQGNIISTTSPSAGQVLKWVNNAWTPAKPDSLRYSTGIGITINKDTISSAVDEALWNASKLQGRPVDTAMPAANQVLLFDGKKWKAKDNLSGWVVDSTKKDTSNLYAAVKGNVGIGTKKPLTLFHVQAGSSDKRDSAFVIDHNGRVGIGTTPTDTVYKLLINGSVRAKKIVVESGWADHVFDNDYPLMSLEEVAQFIKANHHLPNMPSAQQVAATGLDIAAIQVKMMEKIEELTLYLIGLKKENEVLKEKISALENQLKVRK